MELVFELPAEGPPRRRRGQAEQDAAVELERARAEIVHHAKQLWPNAVILLADRRRCQVSAR